MKNSTNDARDSKFIAFMYLKIQESMNKFIGDVELLVYFSEKDDVEYLIPEEILEFIKNKKGIRRQLKHQRDKKDSRKQPIKDTKAESVMRSVKAREDAYRQFTNNRK